MPTLHSAIEPNLARAMEALDGTGLPWLLLRGEDDLARPSGDVDLLVSPRLLPILDKLFKASGFCRVLAPGHGSHRFYFCYSPSEEIWVKLDIVSDIAFGPYQQWRTPLAAGCLDRRRRIGPLWLPSIQDQSWLQILHLFLDKGEIAASRIAAARSAAQEASASDALACFIDGRIGPGTAAQVLELILSGRFSEVPAASARMGSNWSAHSAVPRLLAVTNKGFRLLSPRLQGPGLVAGVMAPDGAGKTTLLHGIQTAVPLPTTYVYMGLWGAGPWDHWLSRLAMGMLGKKVFRILRGALVARYHSMRGRIVLLDRVAYDALIASSEAASVADRLSDALALRLGPDPDVLFVLDAPGELMFARKGEHSAEVLEDWRKSYLRLAERLPAARVLDATEPQAVVQRCAVEILWEATTPGTGDGRESDRLGSDELTLHSWRLLDWRFLLPGLEPRSVGYGGRISREMKIAIQLLDPNAARIKERSGTFDVVLLSQPDAQLFREAAATLQPGGWMCAQVRRSLLSRSGPRTLAGWKRAFARSGFLDISVHWHAPTLDQPSRIVPVASVTAVRNTLSRHGALRFGKARSIIGRLALVAGLFGAVIPEGTVTGRRPDAEPEKGGLPQ